MPILELKLIYNSLIKRMNKAEQFFDDPGIEQSKKDMWIDEFNKITINLSLLLIEYKK